MIKRGLFTRRPETDPELQELKAALSDTQGDLARAWQQFNHAVDPELVEASVFQISAVWARRNYLIRTIKEREADLWR